MLCLGWLNAEDAKTICVCIAFMIIGPAVVLVNARLMNEAGYHYPAIVSSIGLVSTMVFMRILTTTGAWHAKRLAWKDHLTVIVPIGAMNSLAIVTGSEAYLYLSIAFIQMLKALTPVVVLMCSVVFGFETFSSRLACAVIIISVGSAISSAGEVAFSMVGFWLMSLSHIGEALRIVLTELTMKKMRLSPFDSLYHVAATSAACQFCYIVVMERNGFGRDLRLLVDAWPLALASSLLGLAVNASGVIVIGRTSGLSYKLLGILRGILFTMGCAAFVPRNTVTPIGWFGYSVSLVGFMLHHIETKRRTRGVAAAGGAQAVSEVPRNEVLRVTKSSTDEDRRQPRVVDNDLNAPESVGPPELEHVVGRPLRTLSSDRQKEKQDEESPMVDGAAEEYREGTRLLPRERSPFVEQGAPE
mmetsp:Transcript_42701/g.117858  ORF Transcript_42701/g.117858 Transcript_42701/m.117858 type:complete len:415 (-) Transcript_42701:42-1286(-)